MNETLLFWMVLFGFLVFDNFILVQHGKDFVTINKNGRLIYKSRTRTLLMGKDVLVLNPFNLFDRVVCTNKLNLIETRDFYKREVTSIRNFISSLTIFVYVGWMYIGCLIVCCYLSFSVNFEFVVIPLLICHFTAWMITSIALYFWNKNKTISTTKLATQILENLFVPAYIVNLNRKLIQHLSLDISSIRFYVRNLKREDSHAVDKIRYELSQLIDSQIEVEEEPVKLKILEEFKRCLAT
jgi:hypothetical protein